VVHILFAAIFYDTNFYAVEFLFIILPIDRPDDSLEVKTKLTAILIALGSGI
jgi:hypothetical protein